MFGSRRRITVFFVLAVAGMLASVALAQKECTPGDTALLANGQPAWTEGVEQLTWYNAGDLQFDPAIVEGALAFEKQYGIHINLEGIPESDFVTKAARFLATGDKTYDLFDMYMAFPMPDWAERGWLAPVDCAVPDHQIAQWPEGYWSAAEYQGQHYFVPHIVQPFIFLWNKAMFAEAGLDPNRAPESWDELLEYAKKLTKDNNGDGNIDQWGFVFPGGKIERVPILTYAYFLGMAGERLWNEDGSPAFADDTGVEVLQFMADLVNKDQVTPKSVINYDTADVADIFRSGGAAMVMHFVGHPVTQEIEALGLDAIGAAPPPGRTADTNVMYPFGFVGPAVYVNAKSDHKEAALRFAAYMGSYTQSWRETVVEGNVGANLEIWDSPYVQTTFPFADTNRAIMEKSYVPTHTGLLTALTVFQTGVQGALAGKVTGQQAVDQIVSDLTKEGVIE